MNDLRKIYRKMSAGAGDRAVVLLDYTVNTVLSEGAIKKGMKTAPSNVKLLASKDHVRCISKEMSFYQDEKNAFTVIPSRKMIYWSNSTAGAQSGKADRLSMLQDTLFTLSKVIECRKEQGSGYDRCIVIQPNAKAQKMFNISRMSFYVSDAKEEIKKVVIIYLEQDPVVRSEIVFNEISTDHKGEDISKPVKGLFIQAKGKLSPEYKSYTLVDNRAEK
jgi:hypothetical protein